MTGTVIYIDGKIVDLSPGTVVACTFKALEVGNIKARSADYTNSFKLPKTPNNIRIFENADNVKSGTLKPYRRLPAKIVQGGLEIMPSAVAIITEASTYFSVNIYASVKSFFEAIEGRNVDDIDFGEYAVIDDAYIDSIRESTDLISAPVIDFGTLSPPVQELKNTSFQNEIAPWTNEGTGEDWRYDGVLSSNIYCAFASTTLNETKFLTQEYKIFKGFVYRLRLTIEVSGFNIPTDVTLSLRKDTTRFSFPPIQSLSVDGVYQFDETFTAANNYDFIEILAEAVVVTLGEHSRVHLRSIQITDIAGLIDIKADRYIPLISYSKIIEKIVTDAGYQLSIFSDSAFYEKLFISFSKDHYGYPDSLIDKMGFNYSAPGTQVLTVNSPTKQEILFNVANSHGLFGWYDGSHTYAPQNIGYNVKVVTKARIVVDVVIAGSDDVAFYFRLDGATDTLTETVTTSGTYVFTFESNVIDAGVAAFSFKVSCARSAGSGSNTVTVVEGQFYSEVSSEAFDTINISALVLPTVKQKDFLKDFLYRFGVVVKELNGVVYMKTIQSIIEDRANAVDWTGKRDVSAGETLKFESSYAQENFFSDIKNEDFIIQDQGASLLIDNDNLPESEEYYTSIMSSTQQTVIGGMMLPKVPIFDEVNAPGGIGSYPTNPRLFHLRTDKDSDSEVKYNSVVKTSFLVAVYNDPLATYNTTWKYLLANYYNSLGAALQKNKSVVRSYVLNELDIAIFDQFKPIYDDGAYYIFPKVENFIPGRVTKVELFKVS